jgi:hypothetical protein
LFSNNGRCSSNILDRLLLSKYWGALQTAAGREKLGTNLHEAPPYPGAKLYFRITEELDDKKLLSSIIAATANELPTPKPKKPKKPKVKK